MARAPGPIGRPINPRTPGKRASLGLKVTDEIKYRLDTAARGNGRTQSQEAEVRLEQSFRKVDLLPQVLDLAYGARPGGLLFMIGWLVKDVAGLASAPSPSEAGRSLTVPDDWITHPWARHQVADALRSIADELDPDPERVAVPEWIASYGNEAAQREMATTGWRAGKAVWGAVRDPQSHVQFGEALKPAHERLGAALDHMQGTTR